MIKRKLLFALIALAVIIMLIIGCNTIKPGFSKAYIRTPGGGAKEVNVLFWTYLDTRGSKMLIISEDGKNYIASSYNVTLTNDEDVEEDDMESEHKNQNETNEGGQ